MIEKLTEEQKAKFPYYVKKWKSIGLDTTSFDKKEVEEKINNVYKTVNIEPSKINIFVQSPLGCLVALEITKNI